MHGDFDPMSDAIKLSESSRSNVYQAYKEDRKLAEQDLLSKSEFLQLWRTQYPDATLRDASNIFGKCMTCYLIQTGKRSASTEIELQAFEAIRLLHKCGLFGPERMRYLYSAFVVNTQISS